ncbi:hypothetical protein ACVWZ8_000590 [Arthrobacter sp. UYCu723]
MTEAFSPAVATDTAESGITPDPDAGLRQLAAGIFGLPHLRAGQLAGMEDLVTGRGRPRRDAHRLRHVGHLPGGGAAAAREA